MAHSVCRLPVVSKSSPQLSTKQREQSQPLKTAQTHLCTSLHHHSSPNRWGGLQRRTSRSYTLHAVGSEQKSAPQESSQQEISQPSRPLHYGSQLERFMPEKDILQKAEEEMSEKCTTLEGDDAYDCWQTVFEFENEKATAERECILAPPGEKQQACGPLESLQTLVREGSAQGVSAVLANIKATAQSKKARKASDAKKAAAAAESPPPLVTGAARKTEADRAEFEVPGGRTAVAMAEGEDPRSEASTEEWENQAAEAAAEGMEDRLRRAPAGEEDDNLSAVRRILKKRGLSAAWLQVENV